MCVVRPGPSGVGRAAIAPGRGGGRRITPEDLAARHPRLYHLTAPDALPGILRHGLLPTSRLLDLFEVPEPARAAIERRRRPAGVPIAHPVHGTATITDNLPLSEAALAACLDDGMTPADWLLTLNARTFFWAEESDLAGLLNARLNRGRARLVLVLDTLSLTRACAGRVEIAPINTGATIRKAARRGRATFTPLGAYPHEEWRRLRGGRDRVREVTVIGGVERVGDHLVRRYVANGAG